MHESTGATGAVREPNVEAEPSVHRLLRAEIVSHTGVPSVPALLGRVLSLSDAEADVRELLSIVDCDPGLTARILRTANSPYFGQARRVASLDRAAVVLGTSMVWNLALSLTAWQTLGNELPQERVAPVWTHSMAVAWTAHRVAARSRAAEESDAFTAGLLHDAGRLIIARLQFRSEPPGDVGATPTARDRMLLELDHAEVGAWLFEAWRMPQAIVAAAGAHHEPTPAVGLPAIVAAADFLVHLGPPVDGVSESARERVAAHATILDVDPDLLLRIAIDLDPAGLGEG